MEDKPKDGEGYAHQEERQDPREFGDGRGGFHDEGHDRVIKGEADDGE